MMPLFDALDRVRRVSTNLFASRAQLEEWSARGILSWTEYPDCVLIFRRSADFHHVYHVAASLDALSHALKTSSGILATDLVGREEELVAVRQAYANAGFREHRALIRMARIVDDSLPVTEHSDVIFADASDAKAIRLFLLQLLDRFADQIPEEEELRGAAGRRNILLVKKQGAVAGLLIFEKTGLTTTLRYWYVDPECQGEGIGARLMNTFFRLNRDGRRLVLWVVRDNAASIEKYLHYEFRKEPLMDQIMTRNTTVEEVLKGLRPEFDFTTSDDFIGDGMLDSHDIVALVADLDRMYGIRIAGIDIVPENFQSIAAIEQLVSKSSARS